MKTIIWYLVGGQMLGSIERDDQGRPFTRASAVSMAIQLNMRARRRKKGESYLVKFPPK